LILLGLFAIPANVQSLFADTVRNRQAKQTRRIDIPRRRAPAAKKKRKPASPPAARVHIQGDPETVFLGLDRDGDGFISRKEWPDARRSFDVLDRNDDGRIGQDELRSHQSQAAPRDQSARKR
jgi:hypothetical protein